jgi:hypothetical protein
VAGWPPRSIQRHPSKTDKDGRRHFLIRAIPYQDPQPEAERLKAVHEARALGLTRNSSRRYASMYTSVWSPEATAMLTVRKASGAGGPQRLGLRPRWC